MIPGKEQQKGVEDFIEWSRTNYPQSLERMSLESLYEVASMTDVLSEQEMRRCMKNEPHLEWRALWHWNVYELWTWEYINRLSRWLTINHPNQTIIEVGAGNGNLSQFLRTNGVRCNGIDNNSDGIKQCYPVRIVEDTEAVLMEERPDVIIMSWMRDDLSAMFRRIPSVQRYILIGESDYGCCGDNWDTWGKPRWGGGEHIDYENEVPPYIKDGWNRKRLDFGTQYSRTGTCTTTISFERGQR